MIKKSLLAIVLCIPVMAFTLDAVSPVVASTPKIETSASAISSHLVTSEQDKQLWNLQDADIHAVVDTVSQLTGKNFIVDPRVQGKVTLVSSKPMTVDEMYNVFLSMLQVLNYSAIDSGNVIKIIPSMDAKGYGGTLVSGKNVGSGDQVVVRVVPINNTSAMQLVSILRPLMLDWGSVNAYQPSNSLILAGAADNINQLVEIVHNLDHNNGSTVEIAHLKYADAAKLAQVIQSLQSANNMQGKVNNVSIVADPEANALLISGNDINRMKTVQLIEQLDTPKAGGGNNTAVIHLNYLTASTLTPMLTKLAHGYVEQAKKSPQTPQGFGVASSDGASDATVSIQPLKDVNSIVLSGPHQIISNLKNVIAELDVRPQEILVQAIIVKIDETAMSQLGIQFGMGDPRAGLAQVFENGMGFIRNGSFSAIVQALIASGNTDILATPSILVLNNQKAMISDGKNIGMYNRQYSTTATTTTSDSTVPFNTYDRQDVTLSLNVTPQIAPDNTVRLTIKQKDDSLAQDAQNQDPNNPTINTSKINTTVLVNSGDVLVLGGLISDNDTVQDQKIPVLGDIPVLGRLFHNSTHNKEKKNLMVFIRPVILNNQDQATEQSLKQYDYIRYQQMLNKNGLGLSDSSNDLVLPAHKDDKENKVNLPPPF